MKKEILTYKEHLMKEERGLRFTDWELYDAMLDDKIDWRKRGQILSDDNTQKSEVSIKVKKKRPEPVKKEEDNYQLLMLG